MGVEQRIAGAASELAEDADDPGRHERSGRLHVLPGGVEVEAADPHLLQEVLEVADQQGGAAVADEQAQSLDSGPGVGIEMHAGDIAEGAPRDLLPEGGDHALVGADWGGPSRTPRTDVLLCMRPGEETPGRVAPPAHKRVRQNAFAD